MFTDTVHYKRELNINAYNLFSVRFKLVLQ
jgi:hypothetical protein